jgi:hypothetical protein
MSSMASSGSRASSPGSQADAAASNHPPSAGTGSQRARQGALQAWQQEAAARPGRLAWIRRATGHLTPMSRQADLGGVLGLADRRGGEGLRAVEDRLDVVVVGIPWVAARVDDNLPAMAGPEPATYGSEVDPQPSMLWCRVPFSLVRSATPSRPTVPRVRCRVVGAGGDRRGRWRPGTGHGPSGP